MNEREWIKEVRKRLEKEKQFFKDVDLSFHDGRKVPYSFKIISYQGNEPGKLILLILKQIYSFAKIFQKINGNHIRLFREDCI